MSPGDRNANSSRAAVELCEFGKPAVQHVHGEPQDRPGGDAAGQPLERAEVEKGPAYERRGCADQSGDFDLLPLRQHLQPDGIEGDGDERERKQRGQNRELQAARPSSPASSRCAHAESSCTWATPGQPAGSARSASSACGAASRGSTTKASGSGFCAQAVHDIRQAGAGFRSASAWSRGT